MNRQEILAQSRAKAQQDLIKAQKAFEKCLGFDIDPEYWQELGLEIIPPPEVLALTLNPQHLHWAFTVRLSISRGIIAYKVSQSYCHWYEYTLNEYTIKIDPKALLKFVCAEIQRLTHVQKPKPPLGSIKYYSEGPKED